MNKKRIEELIKKYDYDEEAVNAYLELGNDDDLRNFEEAYQGKWDTDEDFVKDLIEGTGEIPKDFPAYIHIDWEATARDIMMDYTEMNGHYFRNI